ncbi:MAG: NADH-quinone oxidoreductase subunit C [Desulfonatronovibrio sp.]
MLENTVLINHQELESKVRDFKKDNFRFMALTALDYGNELELIYTFDKNHIVQGIRLRRPRTDKFKSITSIYFAAFLAENETQDFYNVSFEGLAIDYKGHMFVEEEVRNLPYGQIKIKDSSGKQEGN